MPNLSFKKVFAPKVASGEKKMTIRKKRKIPVKVDDTLYLWCTQRSKSGYKIGESICIYTEPLRIESEYEIFVDNRLLVYSEAEQLAKDDGFESLAEFNDFFSKELPFDGDIIYWDELIKYEYHIQFRTGQNSQWCTKTKFYDSKIACEYFMGFKSKTIFECRIHKVKIDN